MTFEKLDLIPASYEKIPQSKGVLRILISQAEYNDRLLICGYKTVETVILPEYIEQLADEVGGFDNFKQIDYYPSKQVYEVSNMERELAK